MWYSYGNINFGWTRQVIKNEDEISEPKNFESLKKKKICFEIYLLLALLMQLKNQTNFSFYPPCVWHCCSRFCVPLQTVEVQCPKIVSQLNQLNIVIWNQTYKSEEAKFHISWMLDKKIKKNAWTDKVGENPIIRAFKIFCIYNEFNGIQNDKLFLLSAGETYTKYTLNLWYFMETRG